MGLEEGARKQKITENPKAQTHADAGTGVLAPAEGRVSRLINETGTRVFFMGKKTNPCLMYRSSWQANKCKRLNDTTLKNMIKPNFLKTVE